MENNFEDRELVCYCGKTFTFTAGEQAFYEKNGFAEPRRCQSCREAKKRQQPRFNGNK